MANLFDKVFKAKLSAFTLSEVLITLGIIGVVAAMTIPMLITNINNLHNRIIYKKIYSNFNQAIKLAEEEGTVSLSLTKTTQSWGTTSSSIGEIFKALAIYHYNAPTLCMNKNADLCWECDKGEAGYIGGGAPNWLGCNKNNYAFIDSGGVAYYLYSNSEYPIIIDVNGKTKPNQLGRDRFVFRFSSSIEPKATYPSNVDSVLPLADISVKSRFCPQGKCYYKSWINGKK